MAFSFICYLQKSFFLKIDLKSNIHPHEIVSAGIAAVIIASTGDILENLSGEKNIINVTTNIISKVIFSYIVDGGVKNILKRSIFALTLTPTFQFFLLLVEQAFQSVLNLL